MASRHTTRCLKYVVFFSREIQSLTVYNFSFLRRCRMAGACFISGFPSFIRKRPLETTLLNSLISCVHTRFVLDHESKESHSESWLQVGLLFLQSLNHFQRYAYVRQAHAKERRMLAEQQYQQHFSEFNQTPVARARSDSITNGNFWLRKRV